MACAHYFKVDARHDMLGAKVMLCSTSAQPLQYARLQLQVHFRTLY